jgi:hypothetical protein
MGAAAAHPVLDLYEGMWHVFRADLVPKADTAVAKSAAFIVAPLPATKQWIMLSGRRDYEALYRQD